jgi:hypothetical protein
MKKLGTILAVVADENCQLEEKPESEQECEQDPCEPRWYMTDWSEVRQFKKLGGLYSNMQHCSFARFRLLQLMRFVEAE